MAPPRVTNVIQISNISTNTRPTMPQRTDSHACHTQPLPAEEGEDPHECAICQEALRTTIRATIKPCNHDCFDLECLRTWLKEHDKCPLCHTTVTAIVYRDADSIFSMSSRLDFNEIELWNPRIRWIGPHVETRGLRHEEVSSPVEETYSRLQSMERRHFARAVSQTLFATSQSQPNSSYFDWPTSRCA